MISIGELFDRIGGVHAREIAFRAGVQSAIKEIVGVDVPIGSIALKSNSVTIKNISSIAQSSIFIKKDAIIDRANKLQSIRKIVDIR